MNLYDSHTPFAAAISQTGFPTVEGLPLSPSDQVTLCLIKIYPGLLYGQQWNAISDRLKSEGTKPVLVNRGILILGRLYPSFITHHHSSGLMCSL